MGSGLGFEDGGRSASELALIDQDNQEAPEGGIPGSPRPAYSAADDCHVVRILGNLRDGPFHLGKCRCKSIGMRTW